MKRSYALLLSAALLLTGCSFDTVQSDTQPTVEDTMPATVTEEAEPPVTTTSDIAPAVPEAEEREVPRYLGDHTYNELKNFSVQFYEMNRKLVDNNILRYHAFRVDDDENMLYIETPDFNVRRSSRALKMSEDELRDMVSSVEYTYFRDYCDSTPYSIESSPIEIFIDEDRSKGLEQMSLRLGCYVKNNITFNAFIKKVEDDVCTAVIDPAYMFDIPLFTNKTEWMAFDINGTEIFADTLSFAVRDYDERDIPTDYVYAKVTIDGLYINYDTESGYDNKGGRFISYELISDDTDSMLMNAYLFEGEGKDPAMSEVYNSVMSDLDTVMADNTNGLTLLDLDFDGTPELLVSNYIRIAEDSGSDYHAYGCDVGVYRIENGGLKYIDTIYSEQRAVYEVTNNLGLITLEDGRKSWFGTSYKNRETDVQLQTDYLYDLVGDKLVVTEVFSEREGDGSAYSDLKYFNNERSDYYYFGERMEFTEVVNEDYVPDEAYSTPYILVWGDESSIFGAWEIYGFARAAFCENIEKSFRLYSPWLSGEGGGQPKQLTERELSYNIAYMVDSFYLGEYNAAEYAYDYWFLGDYAKPVIYLYPEQQTEVSVQVGFTGGGTITCSYPDYDGGWNVTAMPDGTIYDDNGDEYYCLYWEGTGAAAYDTSKGWCVAGADTAAFLREKLMHIGLTAREANEFIIYWLPLMQGNKYNIISLHTEQYAAEVPLTVSPAPDTEIRVFMTYTPSEQYVEIQPQQLPSYERNGFVLVEWGGAAD